MTQWKNFLKEIMNKNSLIHFIVEQWKMEESRKKILFVTCQKKCYKVDVNRVQPVEESEDLVCEHEEADTRMLLHVQHAAQFQYEAVLTIGSTGARINGLYYTKLSVFEKIIYLKE